MNTEQLSRQFFNLKEDCKEYYDNLTSQQEEDIIKSYDDHTFVDYIDPKEGIYLKGEILKLKKNSIMIFDFKFKRAIHIKFEYLTLQDQLTVLELYEQNQ